MRNQFITPKTPTSHLVRAKEYYGEHRIHKRRIARQWYQENKRHARHLHLKWQKRHPWYKSFSLAKQRCMDPKVNKYKYYGRKGIKFLLSVEDAIFLWNRDNAAALKQPSIDRLNSNGDYSLDNCRFIEMLDNIKGREYKKQDPIIAAIKAERRRRANLIHRTVMRNKLQDELRAKTQLTTREKAMLGGIVRANNLSAKRRKEIAKEAAKKRWKNQLRKGRIKT